MNCPCTCESQSDTQIISKPMDSEMLIPDHAIRRFSRFLLAKMQADYEQRNMPEESNSG